MKNQVTNGFDRMSVNNLVAKARFIISEVSAHTDYFPAPDPTIASLQAQLTTFEAAALAAANSDRVAIAYRNELKVELVSQLRKLGSYVNLQANGNRTIALSSGFDVAKEPAPTPSITYVQTPVLSLGVNAGELQAQSKKVTGARAYQYFINADQNVPIHQWQSFVSTRSHHSFTGLQSGKRYYVKVAVVGINNQLVFSEASSFITQ